MIETAFLAAHLYIFGDSLSSPTGCEWSRHLQYDYAIHNMAQAGLTADAFSLPNHWRPRPNSKLVIWLGSNDAGQGSDSDNLLMKIRELIKVAKMRGIRNDDILVVGLPKYIPVEYRVAVIKAAMTEDVKYFKPQWAQEVTSDGLHPTCEYHVQIADDIQAALDGGQ